MRTSARSRRKTTSLPAQPAEVLEQRRVLTGNVHATVVDGSLYITGDRADNSVEVYQNADGDVVVEGINGTTVNGDTDVFVAFEDTDTIPQDLNIFGRRGDDLARVVGVNVGRDVRIFDNGGDDAIGLYDVVVGDDLLLSGGWGDDAISVDSVTVSDRLAIWTSAGDDTVGIDESVVGGRTTISTWRGNDTVVIRNSEHIDRVFVSLGSGDDDLLLDGTTIDSTAFVWGGRGNDDVLLRNSTFNSRVIAFGAQGRDNLQVDGGTEFARTPFAFFDGDTVQNADELVDNAFDSLIERGSRLGTIAELARLTPDLSTLLAAVQAAGLAETLNGTGPFTVFAPVNSAFAALPEGTLDALLTPPLDALTGILQFHVVSGTLRAADVVASSEINTLNGAFSVEIVDGEVILNGNVRLLATNIRAKNGVVHLIDRVLIP